MVYVVKKGNLPHTYELHNQQSACQDLPRSLNWMPPTRTRLQRRSMILLEILSDMAGILPMQSGLVARKSP